MEFNIDNTYLITGKNLKPLMNLFSSHNKEGYKKLYTFKGFINTYVIPNNTGVKHTIKISLSDNQINKLISLIFISDLDKDEVFYNYIDNLYKENK